MRNIKLETAYKFLRVLVYSIPAIAVIIGMYLILFPIENYAYLPGDPDASGLNIEKNAAQNEVAFGVFPDYNYRYIKINFFPKKDLKESCQRACPEVCLEKSYRAFLYPGGEPVRNEKGLREILFQNNDTKIANGSLLHLPATDEVFLLANGKKTLFPGPEIFRAFGYNFDNLTDVDKSTLDQYPDDEIKFFTWSTPHPEGTIFESFPSRDIYVISGKKKRLIEDPSIAEKVWPDYYAIPVSDSDPGDRLCTRENTSSYPGKIAYRFDAFDQQEKLGGYFHFTAIYPPECDVDDLEFRKVRLDFVSEKSYLTVKDSLRNIFASILNRYLYKEAM